MVRQRRNDHSARRQRRLAAAPAAVAVLLATPISAHPHVWVSTRAEVIYENGAITGLRHTWVFDEFYTAGAIEGLDTNGDGKVDRAELAELTRINIEGLKEFDYFTAARFADKPVDFAEARDAVMQVVETPEAPGPQGMLGGETTAATSSGGLMGAVGGWWSKLVAPAPSTDLAKLLVIDFVLPLKQPIASGGSGFSFTVSDPSMFIWLEQARTDPIKMSAAPSGCAAVIGAVELDEEQKRLNDAFGQGGLPVVGGAKTVTITCGK